MSGEQRYVLLLCGPPGAGKSFHARQLQAGDKSLTVYDADDPQWRSEKQFRAALRQLGRERQARAVVIRAGATQSARDKAAGLIGATEVKIIATDPQVCKQRVCQRKRAARSIRTEIAAVDSWWRRYEPVPEKRTSREW